MIIKEHITEVSINHEYLLSFHISRQQYFHFLSCISIRAAVLK